MNAFAEAIRREDANLRATMFRRLGPHAMDDVEHVLLARAMGILPPPSGRTVGARTSLPLFLPLTLPLPSRETVDTVRAALDAWGPL